MSDHPSIVVCRFCGVTYGRFGYDAFHHRVGRCRTQFLSYDAALEEERLAERRQAEAFHQQMERQKSPPIQLNYRWLMGLIGAILFGSAVLYAIAWLRAL